MLFINIWWWAWWIDGDSEGKAAEYTFIGSEWNDAEMKPEDFERGKKIEYKANNNHYSKHNDSSK